MDLDKLTIGEAREIARVFGGGGEQQEAHPFTGRYCVFRGYRSGVCSGKLERVITVGGEAQYLVSDCRRLQYQKYNGFTLHSVATMGIHASSKLSQPTPLHTIAVADISETFACNAESEQSLREHPNATA